MLVFYRLFHRCCAASAPSNDDRPSDSTLPEPSVPPSNPAKDRAILVWWAAFCISLLFFPVAELVVRLTFFSTCALLLGTLSGSLNFFVGHAVLRAAKYDGYESPLISSFEAGSLGGILVIGPTILATVSLVALLGGLTFQRALSRHLTFILELASAVAVSAAACSIGATILQCTRPHNVPLLDAAHAARAGVVGACILTVPIVTTAAFFMYEAQMMPSARSGPPADLGDGPGYRENHNVVPVPRVQHVLAHTTAETAVYVVVMLCVVAVRLLCF